MVGRDVRLEYLYAVLLGMRRTLARIGALDGVLRNRNAASCGACLRARCRVGSLSRTPYARRLVCLRRCQCDRYHDHETG